MKENTIKKTYESGERELVRVNISYPSAPEDYFAGGSRFDTTFQACPQKNAGKSVRRGTQKYGGF